MKWITWTHVTLGEVIDEHFLVKYRMLLDAEDAAFDELEHAFEEGNREHFEADLAAWQEAIEKKVAYLNRLNAEWTAAEIRRREDVAQDSVLGRVAPRARRRSPGSGAAAPATGPARAGPSSGSGP